LCWCRCVIDFRDAEGWFLFIDQIIWQKSNPKPQSNETSRFTNSYESILIFSKSPDYYYDQLRIFDPEKSATVKSGCSEQGNKGLGKKKSYHISNPYKTMRNFLCDNDIEQILKLNISKERSQKDGLQNGFSGRFQPCYPFHLSYHFFLKTGLYGIPSGGTGTTGRAALMLNRKVIISELYEKNVTKSQKFLKRVFLNMMKMNILL
jgi:DNA modification methylase